MLFPTTLLLLLTTSALAAPLPSLYNTSTCKGYNNAQWNIEQSVFEVYIGRPYLGGELCDVVKDKIEATGFDFASLKCSSGGEGDESTKLTIISNMKGKNLEKVNEGLKGAYPEIGFDCPERIEYGQ